MGLADRTDVEDPQRIGHNPHDREEAKRHTLGASVHSLPERHPVDGERHHHRHALTEETGDFAVLRRAFSSVSNDQRVLVIMIAFSFGALLEALAGFGTPIAICSVMLVGVGFKPMKAVALALVADTAPVAFGGIAIPITTLAQVTGLPKHDLSQMIGRQTLVLAFVVPFVLLYMVDGRRGLRDSWLAAVVAGGVFTVVLFATSNFI